MAESSVNVEQLIDELARGARLLRVFSHLGQTDPEVSNASNHVLKVLLSQQPTHAVDLASRLGIGTAAMSRHLGELEKAGFVERSASEKDARRQVLRVTAEGELRVKERDKQRGQRLQSVLPEWDESRMGQATETLRELNDAMLRGIRVHKSLQADEGNAAP